MNTDLDCLIQQTHGFFFPTVVANFWIISSQIKQVKGLELIPNVAITFGSFFCETACGQRSMQLEKKRTILRLYKQSEYIREIVGTLGGGQINSLGHSERKE